MHFTSVEMAGGVLRMDCKTYTRKKGNSWWTGPNFDKDYEFSTYRIGEK